MAAWAPMSTPRVGWAAIRIFGSLASSRPTSSFCWLPPDRANAGTISLGVRTSNRSMTARRRLARCAASMNGPLTELGVGVAAEQGVLPQRGVEQQAFAVAVERDVATPASISRCCVRAWVTSASSSSMVPGSGGLEAEDGLAQLELAVALDAGDAEHLAFVHLEA